MTDRAQRNTSTSRGRGTIPLLAALLVAVSAPVPAARGADGDTQQWSTVTVEHRFADRYKVSLASRLRLDEDISRAEDLLLRPAIEVEVVPAFSLGLGYDYLYSFASNATDEKRLWEQAGLATDVQDLSVGHRLRIEQRFIDGVHGVVVRARYRLRLAHPLGDPAWQLIGSDEVFANLNNEGAGPVSGFEQNRLFGGFGHSFGNGVEIEAGYQLGYEEKRSGQNLITHSLLLDLTYDF